jgi:uncharacterized protein (DUF488 family)
MKIWTIGHSTRSFDELKAALVAHRIELLADVRAFPSSRRYPHFNRAELEIELPKAGIAYQWLGVALGGRRKASRDTSNVALRNDGFRGYADHMASQPFRDGIHTLIERAAESRIAIMCAEQLWWRCHRSMISDYLVGVFGLDVEHIYDARRAESHRLNRLARVENGALIYDRNETGRLL